MPQSDMHPGTRSVPPYLCIVASVSSHPHRTIRAFIGCRDDIESSLDIESLRRETRLIYNRLCFVLKIENRLEM